MIDEIRSPRARPLSLAGEADLMRALPDWLFERAHEGRHFARYFPRQESQGPDPLGQAAARLAVQPNAPGCRRERPGTARQQAGYDPGQDVA